MSNWYRDLKNLMENDAPYIVNWRDGSHIEKMRFDDKTDAEALAREKKGTLWYGETFVADYEYEDHEEEVTEEETDFQTTSMDGPEPCIPRIAYYTDNGKRNYEAILFFPAADANYGKIVCYAHIGQHSEAAMDFFARHTYNVTPANLVRAGLTQEDFNDLIKEWENVGPEHTPVKLYKRDQDSFRKMRWHHNI